MAISLRCRAGLGLLLGLGLWLGGPVRAEDPSAAGPAATSAARPASLAGGAPTDRLSQAFRARSTDEPLDVRVERVRREASAMGMRSAEPAARGLLLARSLGTPAERSAAAVRLAPGLPAAWGALAIEAGGVPGLGYLARGIRGLEGHLAASVWWRATALRVASLTLVLGGTLFLLLAAGRAVLRARHDLSHRLPERMRALPPEALAALLVAAALVPALLGEGLAGLAAGSYLLALAWSPRAERVALTLALVGVVVGIHPLTAATGRWIAALHADPGTHAVARAQVADLSPAERRGLAARADDPAAAYALAVWSRRSGDLAGAQRWLEGVGASDGEDAVLLNQMGNLKLSAGDEEAAIEYYLRALERDRRAEIWFNLAQVYGSRIELAEQQQALEAAHAISPATVRELSELRGDGRLAADLDWPVAGLRERLARAADGAPVASALRRPFGEGRLVASPIVAAAALGASLLLGLGIARGARSGHRCGACGAVRCDACRGPSDDETSGRRCTLCGGPWPDDSGLRALAGASRLWLLRLTPGAAGLSARRPGLGLVSCWAFTAAGTALVLRKGVVPDPWSAGLPGEAAFVLLAFVALAVFGLSTRMARRAEA